MKKNIDNVLGIRTLSLNWQAQTHPRSPHNCLDLNIIYLSKDEGGEICCLKFVVNDYR